ncbi:MAG TPA: hypothetical protein DCE81_01500 [Cytophagales bacterium]|nr:hypothetical protein [Cytophagales bacterium]
MVAELVLSMGGGTCKEVTVGKLLRASENPDADKFRHSGQFIKQMQTKNRKTQAIENSGTNGRLITANGPRGQVNPTTRRRLKGQ